MNKFVNKTREGKHGLKMIISHYPRIKMILVLYIQLETVLVKESLIFLFLHCYMLDVDFNTKNK